MPIHSRAGTPALPGDLVDVPKLITAYYTDRPDPAVATQRVAFGTSGHRGSSFDRSFNEWHIVAITQAICQYRAAQQISGPLFLGLDTHALSVPAAASALEVLAGNGVEVRIAKDDEYTPTPAISHAVLTYNRGRTSGLADGIVVTPSHNPPDGGGFKYDPPNGGPADTTLTRWIEQTANDLLAAGLQGVRRMPLERARRADTTREHDYVDAYIRDLGAVLDLDAVKRSGIRLGVDPLGGAGTRYWAHIADRYGLDLTVTNDAIDPTFRFMTLDWDGKIRMDPSSPYVMARLIELKDRFDIAFACDTDHDRHGVVTKGVGLLAPNNYLAVCIDYLMRHRPGWRPDAGIGKTIVSSSMIDRVATALGRRLFEVPVGFKWFVDGLMDGSLGFVGEESAGASFLRRDGSVWTTDKDGIIPALLSAEITAVTGRDPSQHYQDLTRAHGEPIYERMDAPATPAQKAALQRLSPEQVAATELAGEPIREMRTTAPGNDAAFGGLKVMTDGGWFAARPSGTENIYKIYAESFHSQQHLRRIQEEAQAIVSAALADAR
ncbi:MAG TPA: phosphoglucomutase (alpha-D-glucose-1,6-bisphosphate-dependent) [Candidatus Dormibacteraeota bacterium]|nr:phosphoglucomutase (alpha-D-glucose-1,6-bisphosphate-dependent) [Candidatus Dormibacteraeota bacterium]